MNDRPGSRELLDAVEAFLRDDVIPSVEGHVRYQARVAANVVKACKESPTSILHICVGSGAGLLEVVAQPGVQVPLLPHA